MNSYLSRSLSGLTVPAIVAFAINALIATVDGLCAGLSVEPPPAFALVRTLTLFCAVAWWVQQDSRKLQFPWPLDMGLFLYMLWPFILLYYLFKTRRIKALILIGAFVGVYIVALVVGGAFGVVLARPP